MEKIKLTQEQANIISSLSLGSLGEWFYKDVRTNTDMYKALKDLTIEEIAKAKIIGYEVEPEIKIGDIVECKRSGSIGVVYEHLGNGAIGVKNFKEDGTPSYHSTTSVGLVKKITGDKAVKWKELIFWSENNRGVWELREGDAIKAVDDGYMVEVCEVFDSRNVRLTGGVTHVKVSELKEGYKIVCFAEDRKDLGDD